MGMFPSADTLLLMVHPSIAALVTGRWALQRSSRCCCTSVHMQSWAQIAARGASIPFTGLQ